MMIDLTKPIYDGMPVYEADPSVSLNKIASIEMDGYQNHLLSINMHAGTHVDGYAHMLTMQPWISDLSLNDFIGFARYVSDLDPYNNQGETMLVVKMAGNTLNPSFLDSFIKSNITLIAIEKESVDEAPFPVHKALLSHHILIVENAYHIDRLKDLGLFKLYAIPLKIEADSSPVRLFAEIIK